jgi:hypothetical protein
MATTILARAQSTYVWRKGLVTSCYGKARPYQQTRSFFGLGEIAGVLANPAETLRQLNDSKRMLEQAREEHKLREEAKRIPPKHTFAKLPGFYGRTKEQFILRKLLTNTPKMSVMFGATSVGKTALLREVLATDDFFVLKFDLRISGFADLRSLYVVLCEQFERFFGEMDHPTMANQTLVYKHLIIDLQEKEKPEGGYEVTVADIASLMERLQSSLLEYWEFDPTATPDQDQQSNGKSRESDKRASRKVGDNDGQKSEIDYEAKKTFRKRPLVFLIDEAHKLPALVDRPLALKVFLDTLLVLTKQDRLCHVLFTTSDAFFQHFLRGMNVGHHSQILTLGDVSKEESLGYFLDKMLPTIPSSMATSINFNELYDAFGGKLSHINDYVSAWVNTSGALTPFTSPIFIQAYTLLQFHLTRTNFETYSPLSTATAWADDSDHGAAFEPSQLLQVMKMMVEPPHSVPYFNLCRNIGTKAVDSMIKARILELRWTKTVVPEEEAAERVWSKDGIERPVVLPMTRIIRRAMEIILREEAERSFHNEASDTLKSTAKSRPASAG